MSAGSADKVEHIYCVDPSYTALRVLQKRGLANLYPVNAFGEALPFHDAFFDGAFNVFVIEHTRNPLPMLGEIRRVLKPSGRLVIATDTKYFRKYLRPVLEWLRHGKANPDDPTHVNLMVPNKLRWYVHRARFEIVKEHVHFSKWARLLGP